MRLAVLVLIVASCNTLGVLSTPLRYDTSKLSSNGNAFNRLLSLVNTEDLLQYKGKLQDKNCIVCRIIVAPFIPIIRNTAQEFEYSVIFKLAQELCSALNIESKSVCYQVVPQFSQEIAFLINYGLINEDDICTALLRSTCGTPHKIKQKWNVTIPGGRPAPYVWKAPAKGAPQLRVLHISDIHLDVKYTPGSLAECKDPQCCQLENGMANGTAKAAGYWGDYRNCDTPVWTAESIFQWLAARKDSFDVIYWTGDLPTHHIWNQTVSDQLQVYNILMFLFNKYLPDKRVFPAVGNHESVPVDSFPPHFVPESYRNQWLYDALAQHWSTWLEPQAIETVRYAGFYSTLVKPGFRVISLNTNFGDPLNFWLRVNSTDPDGQLAWFIDELLEAERHGERVHVLGHIPSGQQLVEYSRNFNLIVSRFEATIAGIFLGHTHKDHFEIYYDRLADNRERTDADSARPVAVGYIAPSITPYNYLNPGYRVYQVDGTYANSSFGVLGWDQYIMNLSDANLRNRTDFFVEYNTAGAYQLNTAFPAEMDRLVDYLRTNDTFFNRFYSYFEKMSPYQSKCNEACRESLCCKLRTAQTGDTEFCAKSFADSVASRGDLLAHTYGIGLRAGFSNARSSLMGQP